MMSPLSPLSPGLVPSYVTKIELGQIGATLELPVSLHSDKFVAGGEKLVSRMGNWSITSPVPALALVRRV